MIKVQKWKVFEFKVVSESVTYENPYYDVDVMALFAGPNGEQIMRPAFWIGKNNWCVRFAPISLGEWTYAMSCSDENNLDFNHISERLLCIEYTGDIEIYQRGFLKTWKGSRFLHYNDGTPFFWLGDTHWNLFCYERLDESNKEGFASQFRGMVDKRVEQKFTVYQTNLFGNIDLTDDGSGFFIAGSEYTEINLDFFNNDTDPKMAYMAEKGLVNAMGFAWGNKIEVLKEKLLRFVYYIVARYGAYPMIWTIGGEVPGSNDNERIAAWREVGEEVEKWDGYHHLITTHNTNDRPLPIHYVDEYWHSFSMGQMGHGDHDMNVQHYRDFFEEHPLVPFVEAEAMYTGLNTLEYNGRREVDAQVTINAACRAIQSGCCGYGLGVQGIWNAAWDFNELIDKVYLFWGNQDWRTGIDLPIGDYMTNLRSFYEALPWTEFKPRRDIITFYDDEKMNDVSKPNAVSSNDAFMPNVSALPDLSLIVIYMPDNVPPWIRFLLYGLSAGDRYFLQKYSIITDEYIDIEPITVLEKGMVMLPEIVEVTNVQGWLVILKRI